MFAKPGAQADYYRSVLVEGGIVEITGENIRVDVYQGQNGQSITLELLNAKIDLQLQETANSSKVAIIKIILNTTIQFPSKVAT